MATTVKLERLRADHEVALLTFERENREYFTRFISDRGDEFFAEFAAWHRARLAEQESGEYHFHVILDEHGTLAGRINLTVVPASALADTPRGTAELGYRIGERSAGRGVATAAVEEVCRLAATTYGLSTLTAVTSLTNLASMAVLKRTGFTVVGDATINGRPAIRFQRTLV